MKAAVKTWIQEKLEEFFSDRIEKLVICWKKGVHLNGRYVEKEMFDFKASRIALYCTFCSILLVAIIRVPQAHVHFF